MVAGRRFRRLLATAFVGLLAAGACVLALAAAARELRETLAYTPRQAALDRTALLLTLARDDPSGPPPAQLRTEAVSPRCWAALQRELAANPSPAVRISPNGPPLFRDNAYVVTVDFGRRRTVTLVLYAGRIVGCTPQSAP